jgi:hypothetical protein
MTVGTIIFWLLLALIIFSFPFSVPRLKKRIKKNELLSFILKDKKKEINIAIVVIEFTIILILFTQMVGKKNLFPIEKVFNSLNWWSDILDPLLGVTIALIALGIWFGKNEKEWEDSLEQRLSVSYMYDKKEIMRCEHAVLSHEADIRAWAQTIGSQMGGNHKLKLEPYFEKSSPKIERDQYKPSKRFKHHYFKLFLYELPENLNGLSDEDLQDFDHIKQHKEGNVLVWRILNWKPITSAASAAPNDASA